MSSGPNPISNTDEFLKAILDEIRGLRQDLKKPEPEGDLVQLKEPKAVKRPRSKKKG